MDPRTPPRPQVVAVAAVAVAALALLLTACSGGGEAPEAPTDRIDAIREAREALGAPAQQLAAAVMDVEDGIEGLRSDPTEQAVDELEQGGAQLAAAVDELEAVELEATTADVRSALEAVDRATSSATELVDATDVLMEAGRQLVATDARLEELTATWDQPGSRSEVVARLEETAAAASDLQADGPQACPGPMEVRSAAAAFVAEASRELRDRVAAHDGEGFDSRRADLDEAPFGRTDGAPRRLTAPTPDDDSCPALQEATAAVESVRGALQDMEEALNPTDLAS